MDYYMLSSLCVLSISSFRLAHDLMQRWDFNMYQFSGGDGVNVKFLLLAQFLRKIKC